MENTDVLKDIAIHLEELEHHFTIFRGKLQQRYSRTLFGTGVRNAGCFTRKCLSSKGVSAHLTKQLNQVQKQQRTCRK
jgi:hypothetical protein